MKVCPEAPSATPPATVRSPVGVVVTCGGGREFYNRDYSSGIPVTCAHHSASLLAQTSIPETGGQGAGSGGLPFPQLG